MSMPCSAASAINAARSGGPPPSRAASLTSRTKASKPAGVCRVRYRAVALTTRNVWTWSRGSTATCPAAATRRSPAAPPPLAARFDQDFAVEDDERLRGLPVPVPRRRVAALTTALEQRELPAALLARDQEPLGRAEKL